MLRKQSGDNWGSSGWTNTQVAAAALGVTPRTIREYIRRGELVGELHGKGIEQAYSVSISSLEELIDQHRSKGKKAKKIPSGSATTSYTGDIAETLQNLTARLEMRAEENAELRTRLELTEKAESTLQEERKRLLEDLEREREERHRLQEELEMERSKGFWKRLFGG